MSINILEIYTQLEKYQHCSKMTGQSVVD